MLYKIGAQMKCHLRHALHWYPNEMSCKACIGTHMRCHALVEYPNETSSLGHVFFHYPYEMLYITNLASHDLVMEMI
jgi:hypothetical protein